jgi:hypothetical protein
VQHLDNLCGHHTLQDSDPLACPDLWGEVALQILACGASRGLGQNIRRPRIAPLTSNTSPNLIPESTETNAD